MNLNHTLRMRASGELVARMIRLAIKKQSTTRAVATLLRESAVQYADKEEDALKLKPLTKREVKDLLEKEQEAKAA